MIKYFYGTMKSGKTTELIKTYDQLKRKNLNPVITKPTIDTREGKFLGWGITTSRITKDKIPTFYFANIQEVLDKILFGILLIDEVQFMNVTDIEKLSEIKQDVLCYGLKSDVNANLFPASAKLLAIADEIKEISMLCENKNCINKAQVHSRYINGKLDKSKVSTVIEDGIIKYRSLCFNCWKGERE